MIEAYCKYDKEMDLLVKDVVKYTLNKYGKQLNISTLKEVEVRKVQEKKSTQTLQEYMTNSWTTRPMICGVTA